jgi:hypothetical protein
MEFYFSFCLPHGKVAKVRSLGKILSPFIGALKMKLPLFFFFLLKESKVN